MNGFILALYALNIIFDIAVIFGIVVNLIDSKHLKDSNKQTCNTYLYVAKRVNDLIALYKKQSVYFEVIKKSSENERRQENAQKHFEEKIQEKRHRRHLAKVPDQEIRRRGVLRIYQEAPGTRQINMKIIEKGGGVI